MYIFFAGKTAQEHPLHLLNPGVNEVPDDVGRRLKKIAQANKGFPVRDASPAEEKAYRDGQAKREADLRAKAERDSRAAAAAAKNDDEDADGPPPPEPEPVSEPPAKGKL
jgi:hypothetical protein